MNLRARSGTLNLSGSEIPFVRVVNRRAKRIIFRLKTDGILRITTPPGVPPERLAEIVRSSSLQIADQYNHLIRRLSKFLVLGKEAVVQNSDTPVEGIRWKSDGTPVFYTPAGIPDHIRKILFKEVLRWEAYQYLPLRCRELAKQHGFKYTSLQIRYMTSRWGSCTAKERLTLNVSLMQCPKEIIDYVIIHELCHTRVSIHSKTFWDEVAKYLPDYQASRNRLKQFTVL